MIYLKDIGESIHKATGHGFDHVLFTLSVNYDVVATDLVGRVEGSYFEFYGVEEIVRAYMDSNNLSVATVTGTYKEYSGSTESTEILSPISVLYTASKLKIDNSITADIAATGRFLFPTKTGFVFNGGSFRLNYYAVVAPNSYLVYTIQFTKKDGSTANEGGEAINGVHAISFTYNPNYSKAHVTLGDRTFDLYYVDTPATAHFLYRNVFNALDSISIPASLKKSPSTEFETVNQGKVAMRYDIEHKLAHELKTGPLPQFVYNSLLALCQSHEVCCKEVYTSAGSTTIEWLDVIINKYKFEKSDNPNTPIVLELEYEYADSRDNDAVVIV